MGQFVECLTVASSRLDRVAALSLGKILYQLLSNGLHQEDRNCPNMTKTVD